LPRLRHGAAKNRGKLARLPAPIVAVDVDRLHRGQSARGKGAQHPRELAADLLDVARRHDGSQAVVAHQLGERALGSERQAGPAEIHQLEDLGWIDALGSGHVVENAQCRMALRELLENAHVLDITDLANAQAFSAREVVLLGIDDATDKAQLEQACQLGLAFLQ